MRLRSILAALLAAAAIGACQQPVPGGPEESQAAPSVAPAVDEQPDASATPYSAPNY